MSRRYSAESRSAISDVLRWPSMKLMASKVIRAKLGLVARPSESLAKWASCSASHLASSELALCQTDASRGRSVDLRGPLVSFLKLSHMCMDFEEVSRLPCNEQSCNARSLPVLLVIRGATLAILSSARRSLNLL